LNIPKSQTADPGLKEMGSMPGDQEESKKLENRLTM
jgi:hypothetical protein